ncbi:MAG: hypothetical protein ACQETK_03340 [Pseudomonadota bacterium]
MSESMDRFPAALPHGPVREVFPDVFFVTGGMEAEIGGLEWHFSRNMTVVREDGRLTLINSVRLSDAGLVELEGLGEVAGVVRIGSLHSRDDAFYLDRYGVPLWQMPGMTHPDGLATDRTLGEGGAMPLRDASVFEFRTTRIPEGILHLDREGGILVACDSLQNWLQPDEHFSEASRERMEAMGFFTPANLGPVWMQAAEPGVEDFARLKALPFRHVLCGHGEPLRDTAREDYAATFQRMFGV